MEIPGAGGGAPSSLVSPESDVPPAATDLGMALAVAAADAADGPAFWTTAARMLSAWAGGARAELTWTAPSGTITATAGSGSAGGTTHRFSRGDGHAVALRVGSGRDLPPLPTLDDLLIGITSLGLLVMRRELREDERWLAPAMVDVTPVPLALVGAAGAVLQANAAFAQLFGLPSRAAAAGQTLAELSIQAGPEMVRVARTGTPWRGRIEVRRGHERRECDGVLAALDPRDADAFVLALQDRTEELRAQREVVAREKLATVGEIARGVAHEVNNPLAAIRMEAELLATTDSGEERAASVAVILKEVDRAARIARSLLHLTQRTGWMIEEVQVNDLLRDVVEIRAQVARSEGTAIRAEFAAELPTIQAPASDLQQVFMHLVTNAEHAVEGRPGGLIEVRTRRAANGVEIAISDSGPGVPPELRSRVFDPFFTTKDPDKGTGIGLTLSHHVVAALGGRIWVEDGALGGARFVVELPAAATAPKPS